MTSAVNKKRFLRPEVVAKLDNMFLRARLVVEGYLVGLHKSPYHGFSVEFAEHRAYGPGDEIRRVDWKLYGKTDRFYIKQYEEETNLRSYLIVDTSKSMDFASGDVTKLEYAGYLSAALTYLMLQQRDAVSLTLFDKEVRSYVPPLSTPGHLNTVLAQLEQVSSGPETAIAPTLHQLAEKIRKRGLIILISDLLDDPQVVENNYVVEFDHPVVGPTKWPQTPLTYSKTPLSTRKMAPTHGENTEEILLERLGYTWDDIVSLKDDGVIL